MAVKPPAAVLSPDGAEELAEAVRWAGRNSLRLAVRGGGHSQGGQCLTDRGAVLDTSRLNRVWPPEGGLVRAEGGASWGGILRALEGTDLLPRVLADIPDVTVGGTLSAGGFGAASHRWGAQIAQVEQLGVVTGRGKHVRCSRRANPDLFDAVRAGQGQFGVIAEAWIRLRRAGGLVREHHLVYRDFGRFALDFGRVVDDGRFDRLRAILRQREGIITLQAGIEYDPGCARAAARTLDGLGHDGILSVRDTARVAWAGMERPERFTCSSFHPWRDWFMPPETLPELIESPWLDWDTLPAWPRTWAGIYPVRSDVIDAPLFMRPPGGRMLGFSVLTVHENRRAAGRTARALRRTDRALTALGGRAYLSGRTGYSPEQWREHYGPSAWRLGLGLKRKYDPGGIFGAPEAPFTAGAP